MLRKLRDCFNDERGQGMVEYGLILILIATVIVVAVKTMGSGIEGVGDSVGEVIDGQVKELKDEAGLDD